MMVVSVLFLFFSLLVWLLDNKTIVADQGLLLFRGSYVVPSVRRLEVSGRIGRRPLASEGGR